MTCTDDFGGGETLKSFELAPEILGRDEGAEVVPVYYRNTD